jgi:hypothetical protein
VRSIIDSLDALPWNDPSVDAIEDEARQRVVRYWKGRAEAELIVADAFRETAALLAQREVDPVVLPMLRTAIDNEHKHAGLCHRLAAHYLGQTVDLPSQRSVALPDLSGGSPEARATLYVAAVCCINESIATLWLQGCADRSRSALVRTVNRLHVRDEVLHARVGWAHLGSAAVTPAIRAELGRWLRPLLRSSVMEWLSPHVVETSGGVPDHGLPTRAQHQEVVLGAVRNVVLPGFAHLGISTGRAEDWLRQAFPAETSAV